LLSSLPHLSLSLSLSFHLAAALKYFDRKARLNFDPATGVRLALSSAPNEATPTSSPALAGPAPDPALAQPPMTLELDGEHGHRDGGSQ
jgi:hypothetical protein